MIKFFKYINPIEILGKKGLQSEAKIHYLECTSEGELTDEELQKGINERTRLVAVAQVSNVLGCVNPLQKITEMAHRVGAVVVVDGAQSVPHMPVDVQALDADFLAFSGHKLMGPMGIGCLCMIKGEASDEEIDELEEAGALKDISYMPARVKCAVLGWHTLEEAFKQEK